MNNNDLKKLFKGKNTKPYLIAEIGNNHNGSLKLAKKLIIAAKKNGADCVKFQTFSPSSLFFLFNETNCFVTDLHPPHHDAE